MSYDPLRLFADIPDVIRAKGRVRGFEALRDRLLEDWETLAGTCNPYNLLKLAIEADRHAMFSAVSEEKNRGSFDRELWERYQDYLHGNVDVVPDQGDYRAAEDNRDEPLYDGGDPFVELDEEEETSAQA